MLGREQKLVHVRGDIRDLFLYDGLDLVEDRSPSQTLRLGFQSTCHHHLTSLYLCSCFLWFQLLTLSVSLSFIFPKAEDLNGSVTHP